MNRIFSWIYKITKGSKRRYKKDVKFLNKQIKGSSITSTDFTTQTTGIANYIWWHEWKNDKGYESPQEICNTCEFNETNECTSCSEHDRYKPKEKK